MVRDGAKNDKLLNVAALGTIGTHAWVDSARKAAVQCRNVGGAPRRKTRGDRLMAAGDGRPGMRGAGPVRLWHPYSPLRVDSPRAVLSWTERAWPLGDGDVASRPATLAAALQQRLHLMAAAERLR
jgi:hypothetical protein